MTNEEAKEYWLNHESVEDKEQSEAVWKSINALEKQIAKPKHKYQGYRCVCGKEVAKKQKYCEYCGQKLLDGSDEDDKDRA